MKREINEEFADVWGTMLDNRLKALECRIGKEENLETIRFLESRKSGIIEALALFSCLENGRFSNQYNQIVEELKREKEESTPKVVSVIMVAYQEA